jgi:ferrochelatase
MTLTKNTIIVLCNLGGPRSLDEVKQFLLDLLGDPNVIRLPFLLKPFQKLLAKLIVKRRLPYSKKLYEQIGGKSPLVVLTQKQAELLEKMTGLKTFILMACGKPGTDELHTELKQLSSPIEQAIILPLFPQYSTTTSKSSLEQASKFFQTYYPQTKLKLINSFPTQPKFIAAWVERIERKLKRINGEVKLLFSAHGVPKSYIDSGDPYLKELEQCVSEIMKFFPERKHQLCFQSKFGKGKWIEPSSEQAIEALPAGSNILMIPISFVSDHVETMQEIGIAFKEFAQSKGIKLYRTPGLNSSGLFIESLAELVAESLNKH